MVRNRPPPSPQDQQPVTITLIGVRLGAKRLLPLALFVVPFGIAFGVAAVEQGMSAPQAVAMSALVFSGTAQFAALDFWQDPIAFLSLALVALALNGRHIIMGAALSPWLNRLAIGKRLAIVGLLSDVNFADSHGVLKSGENDLGPLLGGGIALWITWVAGTAIGALGGSFLGDPETYGIDVVMVCFFAAAAAGHLRTASNAAPIIIAALVAASTAGWLPLGWNIILGALAGALTSLLRNAG